MHPEAPTLSKGCSTTKGLAVLHVRKADEIYEREGGWFNARWHFSFDSYRDPENNGIGPLRVFNDDRLVPGAVWPMHPHRDI